MACKLRSAMACHPMRPIRSHSLNQEAIQVTCLSSNMVSLRRQITPTRATKDLRQCLQHLKKAPLASTEPLVFSFHPYYLHRRARPSSRPWLSNKDTCSLNFNIILASSRQNKGPVSDQMRKDLEWTSAGSWIHVMTDSVFSNG